jgi:imidazolonepropionase-like amidohydrolase
MLPAIRGEVPLVIHADDVRQIKAAAAWAGTNQFKWILAGGRDAWLIPDLLAKDSIPVLFSHVFSQPWRGSDRYDVHFRAPEVLRAAGVRVIFSMGLDSFDAPLVKNLPYAAAQAVAFGLPRDEALKGLTLYPAEIAGAGERLGSIAEGKEATIFSCTGDILDIRSRVTRFWIAGKEVGLMDRHTRLYQKYKARP